MQDKHEIPGQARESVRGKASGDQPLSSERALQSQSRRQHRQPAEHDHCREVSAVPVHRAVVLDPHHSSPSLCSTHGSLLPTNRGKITKALCHLGNTLPKTAQDG